MWTVSCSNVPVMHSGTNAARGGDVTWSMTTLCDPVCNATGLVPASGEKKTPNRVHVFSLKTYYARRPTEHVTTHSNTKKRERKVNPQQSSSVTDVSDVFEVNDEGVAAKLAPNGSRSRAKLSRRGCRIGAKLQRPKYASEAELPQSEGSVGGKLPQRYNVTYCGTVPSRSRRRGAATTKLSEDVCQPKKKYSPSEKQPVQTFPSILMTSRRHILRPKNLFKKTDYYQNQ
ncbi:hypothetical protein OUZ56_011676 [Daphnia magna]|uniref:Uncharacterized protein n=1 Tax=Daphnia magna TaxID=35525 RepID=A0ABQ9Z0V6_9CRUS|nr:hypothetical protein OUZ56_011676 [Daphnia magna]